MTFAGCPQGLNFERKGKTHFYGNIFSFSSTNVYKVLKSYLLHIPSVFEKHPKNLLKIFQSDTRNVMSLGRHQDVNLIIIQKVGF